MKPKKRNKPDETSLYVWGIPKQVKKNFKAHCAKFSISMTDAIIKFMKNPYYANKD